jgi:O-antigen/teichoic acid export membrane protein
MRGAVGPATVGLGNLISNLIGAAIWLTLATLLTAEEYGEVNYYIAIASVAATISVLGLNTSVMTFLAKGNEAFAKQAAGIVFLVSIVASVFLAMVVNNIAASFLLLSLSAFSMSTAIALARKSFKEYMLRMILCRSLQFALMIGLYYVMGIQGVIIGYAVPAAFVGYQFFVISRSSFSLSELRPRNRFIIHTYSMSLSQSVVAFADKLIIAPLFGFAVLGIYQFGFQFLVFLAVIPTSLLQYLIPQEASGVERKALRKIGIGVACLMPAIFYLIGPPVITSLFPKYTEAIPIAQILVLGIIPLTVNALINSRLLGTENSKPVLVGAIVYTGTLMTSMFVLGSVFGALGLAASAVMALSIQATTLWILSRHGSPKIQAQKS